MSKDRDISDVEECGYKIEALLKEYRCTLNIDKELGGKLIAVDSDTQQFTVIDCTTDYYQPQDKE